MGTPQLHTYENARKKMLIDDCGREARPESSDRATAIEAGNEANLGLPQSGDNIAYIGGTDVHVAVAENQDLMLSQRPHIDDICDFWIARVRA
jgi:hypothetical protein